MTGNIVHLHGRPREAAQVTRIGFFDHRQCEHLLSANELSRRFAIEAANGVNRQAGFLRTLRDANAKIVLKANAAELSVPGRFSGAVKSAPWALRGLHKREGRPDFAPKARLRSAVRDQARPNHSNRP